MLEDGPLDVVTALSGSKAANPSRGRPRNRIQGRPEGVGAERHVVTEQEVKGLHEANLRQAREFRDKKLKDHEAEEQRQYHKGLDHDITVGRALKFDKNPADED